MAHFFWLQQCLKLAVWYHRMLDPDQGANVRPCQKAQLGFKMTRKIHFLGEGHCAGLLPRTTEIFSIFNLKVHFAACQSAIVNTEITELHLLLLSFLLPLVAGFSKNVRGNTTPSV